MNVPANKSLFIPLVWKNISRNFIKSKFDALQIGSIKSVEFFPTDKENYKMAYLHFDTFYMENKSTENFIKRVMDPNLKAQIIYDDPHYWVVMENKSPQKSLFLAHQLIEDLSRRISLIENIYRRGESFIPPPPPSPNSLKNNSLSIRMPIPNNNNNISYTNENFFNMRSASAEPKMNHHMPYSSYSSNMLYHS